MQPSGKRKVVISFQLEHLVGWGVTIALCIVPVVFWLRLHPIATLTGYIPIMLNIGRVAGLVGTVMYALNLVYATRLVFLERFFGGLNRVYIAHHLLGGLALIMLSIHPLFLALRYATTNIKQAALLLLPNGLLPIEALFDVSSLYHSQVLQQWALFFGLIAFWGMVALLLVTFFIKLPYRLWLFTHKFLGVAFAISGLHILFISSDTSNDLMMKTYVLTIVAVGLCAFVYKTLLGNIVIRRYVYAVREVRQSGGSTVQVMLDPFAKALTYKPGQFVFVRFRRAGNGISKEWHPFSISSSPGEAGLELSIKSLGDYTSKLSALQPGTQADIEGAYGRFSYTNYRNTSQIWIAGGIGVTPFLSMMKDLPDTGCHVDLYYSVKTYSYSLACANAGGSGSATTTVAVSSGVSSSPPVVSISASPTTIGTGSSSTLSWSATNSPSSCTASNAWSGAKSASGSQSTGAIGTAGTYTYGLSCTNAAGTGSASAAVSVIATPAITLSLSPTSINTGSSSTITWSVTNSPTSCTAGGSWSGSKAASGSQSTGAMATAGSYSFSLSCTNAGGTTSSSAVLAVTNPAPVYCGGNTPCYGVSDLAAHASVGNCWGWNNDWVINITSFRPSHKGGIQSGATSTLENASATCNKDIHSILTGGASIPGYRDSRGSTTFGHASSTINNSASSQLLGYRVGYYDATKP